MSSSAGDYVFVTRDELEKILDERCQSFHQRRWRAVTVWIVIFTALVTFVLVAQRHQAAIVKKQRNAQLSVIVTAGHQECTRSFAAMTSILSLTIPPSYYEHASNLKKKQIDRLFAIADPTDNCPPNDSLTPTQKKILKHLRVKKGQGQ